MLKILLFAAIVFVSAQLGRVLSDGMDSRRLVLIEMVRCVRTLKNALLFQRMPLPDALMHVGSSGMDGLFSSCSLLMNLHGDMRGGEIAQEAWKLENSQTPKLSAAQKQSFELLLEQLSVAQNDSQLREAIGGYLQTAQSELSDLSKKQAARGKLAKSLCIAGGLTVAILII